MKTAMALVCAVVLFSGCDCAHDRKCAHEHDEHKQEKVCGHDHVEESKSASGSGAVRSVRVSKAVQGVMGLETAEVEHRDVSLMSIIHGRYELQPDARETIATPVAGRLEILVKSLSTVSKGDALFKISSPGLVARAREISVLEKRLEVYKEIKTPNAALENELAVKRAERSALLDGAEEKDGVVTVRAHSGGLVEYFCAKNGDWLETGAAAIQVVRPRSLRFKALMASSDAKRLEDGMKAKVGGNLGHIRIGVGDGSGLVPVYVVFPEEIKEVAGARAEAVVFADGAPGDMLAVPSSSIVMLGLQPVVFTRDKSDFEKFIAVDVIPGRSTGGWTQIKSLPSGAGQVVVKGALELKFALLSGGEKPSGHFHADGTFHDGDHG